MTIQLVIWAICIALTITMGFVGVLWCIEGTLRYMEERKEESRMKEILCHVKRIEQARRSVKRLDEMIFYDTAKPPKASGQVLLFSQRRAKYKRGETPIPLKGLLEK